MSLFKLPDDPTVYAVFPQELIDKVIESLDPTDLQTFRACSLIARSWTYSSWAMLFRSISITSWEMFERWCLNTTPGPNGPGSFVHSLTFDEMRGKWITPGILLMRERHLRSFKNLVSFTAIGLQINHFFDDPLLSQCFGLFCRGVREVRLLHPHGSPRIVASFIQQFPIIRRLSIEFYKETWSPPPIGRNTPRLDLPGHYNWCRTRRRIVAIDNCSSPTSSSFLYCTRRFRWSGLYGIRGSTSLYSEPVRRHSKG